MSEDIFRFKRFAVCHGKSSMKIGVDAVLIGAWAGQTPGSILDVGTGCGVIALILAQRFPQSKITAVDIDKPSIEEAISNFEKSPWSENLYAISMNFPKELSGIDKDFDLIISNPPYFNSGISKPVSRREIARHQSDLSPVSLIRHSKTLLSEKGRVSMIVPLQFKEEIIKEAEMVGLALSRICLIRDNISRPVKRVMVEFTIEEPKDAQIEEQTIVLFNGNEPTPEYKNLCKEFYLKF